MAEIIFLRKHDLNKSFFSCNKCGKEILGYNSRAAKGEHKFCSKICQGFINKNNIERKRENKLLKVEIAFRVMVRDASIIETHVVNPGITYSEIADTFKVSISTVKHSIDKYYIRGGDHLMVLNSGIDTEKAIQQAKEYEI